MCTAVVNLSKATCLLFICCCGWSHGERSLALTLIFVPAHTGIFRHITHSYFLYIIRLLQQNPPDIFYVPLLHDAAASSHKLECFTHTLVSLLITPISSNVAPLACCCCHFVVSCFQSSFGYSSTSWSFLNKSFLWLLSKYHNLSLCKYAKQPCTWAL